MSVFLIVGTRPQIIKSVPIMHEAVKQSLPIQIIHTGQHYDPALSQVFFDELSPPEPFANLGVGSGSHVFQTAEIMLRLEKILVREKPSLVLVPGDTNSALAGALTGVKIGFSVAHVESGARCYDMQMAEEINRRLIDHCSRILFAPTTKCGENLRSERVSGEIHMLGDTMLDVFLSSQKETKKCKIISELGLEGRDFAVLTTHRAENVDNPARLKDLFIAIKNADMDVVFPIHPRTRSRLKEAGITFEDSNIRAIDPIGYIEMLTLLKRSKIVLTDSGGLQKEAFWSKVPCLTLRDRTEWSEPIEMGVTFATGINPTKIVEKIRYIENNYQEIKARFASNPFGDGRASEKIVKVLKVITEK
jgi:UDP-N-acetylglucosamine 2-epimerase